jgi:DNA-binding GntR family transcriptional regulator
MGVHDLAIPKIVQLQLAEQVSGRLRELIFECRLLPGARLVERDLAELLGVSRTPVREALFQLRQEGLVTAPQGRGLFVSELDETEIAELYQAIAALERAALLHTRRADGALLADLAAARERFSASAPDPARAIAADGEWHEALTRACGNAKLLHLLRPLRALSRRYERAFFGETANLERSIREHRAIETLLRRGDLARAAEAIETHWLDNIAPMRAAVARAQKSRVSQ